MKEFNYKELLNNEQFPLLEAEFYKSSNASGHTVEAYVVTKAIRQNEMSRIDALVKCIELGVTEKATVIRGFEYSASPNETIPDKFVSDYKVFEQSDKFQVIWLDESQASSEPRGNCYFEVTTRRGLILKYPDE